MTHMSTSGRRRGFLCRAVLASAVLGLALAGAGAARAEDDAAVIVKAMSDYVASQKALSITFDTAIEVVTPQIQKIRFTSSGSLDLDRPNRIHARRTGGYADVEAVSDGKTFTVLGRNVGRYAQFPVEGATIADIVSALRQGGAELPAADLISGDAFGALMGGVIDAHHIGRGVIDGVECEHLAFRTIDTDIQLWVEVGPKPIPRQLVITSKGVAAAPEYTLRIKNWNASPNFAADAFTFTPPAGAQKVDFAALGAIDEVPPGATMGEAK